jgi:hypothetical protein
MSYTKLLGCINKDFDGGVATIGMHRTFTFTFTDGTVFEVAVPFLPIGGNLVITPKFAVNDDDKTLTVDLTRWCPGIVSEQLVTALPVDCGQATAVRVTRAYDADPTTSWTDPVSKVSAWMLAWASTNGLTASGVDDEEVPA